MIIFFIPAIYFYIVALTGAALAAQAAFFLQKWAWLVFLIIEIIALRSSLKDAHTYKEPKKKIFMYTYPSVILPMGAAAIYCANEVTSLHGFGFLLGLLIAPMVFGIVYLIGYGIQSLCCHFTNHVKGAICSAWIVEIVFSYFVKNCSLGLL